MVGEACPGQFGNRLLRLAPRQQSATKRSCAASRGGGSDGAQPPSSTQRSVPTTGPGRAGARADLRTRTHRRSMPILLPDARCPVTPPMRSQAGNQSVVEWDRAPPGVESSALIRRPSHRQERVRTTRRVPASRSTGVSRDLLHQWHSRHPLDRRRVQRQASRPCNRRRPERKCQARPTSADDGHPAEPADDAQLRKLIRGTVLL